MIQKGDVTYKGKQFQFDRTGKMVKGWITIQSLDQNIYKSRTVVRGFDPIKVRKDEILEVVGEDGPLWFKVNYNGQTYVVQKLFTFVFDQSLSNKIDTIRQDIDDLKKSTELVKKYSERYKKAKETKNDDAALVESSELAQNVSQLLTTLKKSELKNTVDKIYEKEADPAVREKYNSTIATLEMMNQDFGKIHKLMLLKDSIMIIDKANQGSGNIIQQIQEGKYLVQQDKANVVNGLTDYKNSMTAYKKQMLDWFVDTVDAGTDAMIMFMDMTTAYSLSINKVFIEPAEKWVGTLPKGEIEKFADGVRDYGQQLTAMQEGFKNRLPEYKQMASDLRVVNQSFHKFGDSVQKAGASLHKQAIMADGLINSVSTHVAEAQQAFPTLHTNILSGLDAANNMMDSANKIASYKIDVPAASQNIGNIDLSNALLDLGGDPSRVYDRKNDGDLSFVLGITPIIGTGKEIGQLIKGEDLVTGQKYGPEDYVWGTLAVVSGGTTRVVGKVFGKVADLEKKGKALEAAAKNTKFTKYPTGFDEVAQYIKQNKKLPDNFITKDQEEALGWVNRDGNLHRVAPGKSIGGDIFENRKKQLPDVPGRTWYEADINYISSYRGNDRIVYSSDGLIYKTSDYYKTFTEIK
ncbi:ribonuclease domain-containing protein [Bacillus thuringiensis]|uniref:ribonuclease domain-containing protein n=1 Tax=Bacillus thuringiensis TaxID=1428 RepID=UPI0036705265